MSGPSRAAEEPGSAPAPEPQTLAIASGTEAAAEAPVVASDGLAFTVRTRRDLEYSFQGAPGGEDQSQAFNALDEGDRERFRRNREMLLRIVAAVADKTKLPIGFFQKHVRPVFSRTQRASLVEAAQRGELPSARQMGHETVQSALRELDAELWRNAPVVARANEFGGSLEVGLSGGAKVGKWGFYGITGLGITLSYDPAKRAAVFEVYQDVEWAKTAVPGYGGLGVFGSLLGSAMHYQWKDPLTPERGNALCMPFIVGCISKNNLRLGTSKELGVGFPGVVVMNSNLIRVPLFRLGVSPTFPGFVRVKSALGPALRATTRFAQQGVRGLCSLAQAWLGRPPKGPSEGGVGE